jgi:hypothetical protein
VGVKCGLSHEGKNIGWSVFENRTWKKVMGCWENYLMRNFIIFAGFFKMLVPVERAA